MYSDTANIIVGLDTSDIYEQISMIVLYKSTIDSRATNKEYAEVLDRLQNRINNLKQLAKHLKALTHTRSKRGLFNIIGSVSKSLFRTLDNDDLTLINENMDKLFDNNNKIKTIIPNQTALIRKIVNSENLNHLEKSYNDVLKQQ